MNPIDMLRTFVRVTELSSFTQAADSLGLPKANVSDAIRSLEDLLGTRLLHRTTRKVQATQDGLALYERAKDLLIDMESLESMFRHRKTVLSGRLRVDVPTLVARRVVMPRLGEFLSAHPGLEIEVSSTDRRVDLVREGFDCVLRVGELQDSSLVVRPLGAMRVANFASAAYLERYGIPQTLDDLAHHQMVHYVSMLGSRSPGFEYLEDGVYRSVAMAGSVTVNNADAYEAAALSGLGIIQAPTAGRGGVHDMSRSSGVRSATLAASQLIPVLPGYAPSPMPVSLLYASRRHLPERVRVFMDWLAKLMEPDLS
jgi:DNA-binding transcriptional LysR family regulator